MIGLLVLLTVTSIFFILSVISLHNPTYEEFLDEMLGYAFVMSVSLFIMVFCSVILVGTYLEYGTIFI